MDGAVPTAAVIERVRELTNTNVPILLLAGAAKPATLQFLEQVPNVVSWAAGGLTKSVDLDYWKVSALFDRRDMKIVPRMSMWLLDRMDWYDARLRAAAKTDPTPDEQPENNDQQTTQDDDENHEIIQRLKLDPVRGWVVDDDGT